jgi:hypothetical protein
MEPLEQSESPKQKTYTPDSMEIEHSSLVYQEVRRAFDFLVETVNFQQTRIANVLLTNSLILGFSGSIAIIYFQNPASKISVYLYVASLCCFILGLMAAVVALWPRIPSHDIDLFLNPRVIQEQGRELCKSRQGTQQFLEGLSDSIVTNAERTHHTEQINFRRRYIRIQLISILGGLILLVVAIITRLFFS